MSRKQPTFYKSAFRAKKEPPSIAAKRPVRRKNYHISSIPCYAIVNHWNQCKLGKRRTLTQILNVDK